MWRNVCCRDGSTAFQLNQRRLEVQYTIEARELTNENSHGPKIDAAPRRTTIEAQTPDDAITQFAVQSAFELVHISRPARGRESIATARHGDSVFLVRCYAA